MNPHQKLPPVKVRDPAYRKALQRLDEALERNSGGSNAEKLQALGRIMFGDLWDQEGADSDSTEKPE